MCTWIDDIVGKVDTFFILFFYFFNSLLEVKSNIGHTSTEHYKLVARQVIMCKDNITSGWKTLNHGYKNTSI